MWTIEIKMPLSFLDKLRTCFSILLHGLDASVEISDERMLREIKRMLADKEV